VRDGDGDRVGLGEPGVVGGGGEAAALDQVGDFLGGDVLDVGLALVQEVDDALADVVADDLEARLGELDGQGEPDIAEADDGDGGGAVVDLLEELVSR
jgi:hypothetical protein